ncbi:hypothetical protein B0O80DRAFT_460708 [Mortierella sp. GBAus27b]|nr:hypothetical protein B0O80DRAFT_460708 [Mortierella sp. GBAus27b]
MATLSAEAQDTLAARTAGVNRHGQIHPSSTIGQATLPAFANHAFSHLTLYTGNTMRTGTTGHLNSSLLKSNQELVSAVQETLIYSLNAADIDGDTITITDETSIDALEGDRSSYEITAKMFYVSPSPPATGTPLSVDQLTMAFTELETALKIPEVKVDHFILALPNQTFDENELDESEVEAFAEEMRTTVLPVWSRLSEWHRAGRIGRLGVAEFSKQQLEILKTIALEARAEAPKVNQVSLEDCCVLPKDLIQYAKEEGIELLTHGDSTQILPKETLQRLLERHLPVAAKNMQTNFVIKYSAFITSRGLIAKKGYVVDASSSA